MPGNIRNRRNPLAERLKQVLLCMVILLCKTQQHLKSCKELDQINVCAQKLTYFVTLNLVTSLLAKCDMHVTMGHCASTLFEGITDTYIYLYSICMADVIMHHWTRPNMAMSQCQTLQNGLCVSNKLYPFVLICGLCSIFGMTVIIIALIVLVPCVNRCNIKETNLSNFNNV